ncbi:hypothetical protein ACN26Y_11315 [Micromonospora sp. WMMD558]|uniref:hypothetical protein n=1 Tax=unclassified Micromonospora TaxID=2617518 RepID=UPI0012B49349|nr:hypothetical protein [Micromonospora sp. WMMC415]QGN46831.1 hypothetical protein GKC29_08210 [Micromonospora sp. WMMC415]
MVYRYESDEDAFVEHPEPGSDLSALGPGSPPPAGPSPSRFPTPSLPRTTRRPPPPPEPARPPAPEPPRAPAPKPAPTFAPEPAATYSAEPVPARAPAPAPAAEPSRAPAATPPQAEVYSPAAAPPPRGGGRMWQVVVGGAAVLVLLALCGLGAAALLGERGADLVNPPNNQPAAADESPEPEANDLDSRDTDQAPLSAKEVFPGKQLVVSDGQPAYQVLKTQSSGSCAVAATGEVADLLTRLGCNQVVRATLRTRDGDHLVTAGLFNLTDRASAERARDRIRQMLDERQGRFRGMAADEESEAIATAPARVGWQVRGHYLAYALVARSDGESVRAGDTQVREILFDMIELHLNQGVLERRANGGVAGQPTADPDDGTASQNGTRN